jgi:thymidylate kinase
LSGSYYDDGRLRPGTPPARLVEALLRRAGTPAAALELLRGNRIPPAAVDEVARHVLGDDDAWREAARDGRSHGTRISRALAATAAALRACPGACALAPSALGPLWMRDVDVLVEAGGRDAVVRSLADAGFVDLSGFAGRSPGLPRFAATEGTEILASVDLGLDLFDDGPSAAAAVARARAAVDGGLVALTAEDQLRRRAGKIAQDRQVALRDGLELLELLPKAPDAGRERIVTLAVSRCAALERELGLDGAFAPYRARRGPIVNDRWIRARARAVRRRARPGPRRPRVAVSFSGVDGAGKSTQAARLVDSLTSVGVPATTVWARIGYSGSRLFSAVVTAAQRVLPARHHSAQRQRAAGTATPGKAPMTRRGVVGWSWALASTLEYLRVLRLEMRRSSARVVVFDRGLPDALVGLEEEFGGAVRLRLHRRLIRRWGPRADVMFYLRLSGHAARGRKEDSFAAEVLEAHAHRYEQLLARMPGAVVVLDAQRPPAELAQETLRRLAELLAAPPS